MLKNIKISTLIFGLISLGSIATMSIFLAVTYFNIKKKDTDKILASTKLLNAEKIENYKTYLENLNNALTLLSSIEITSDALLSFQKGLELRSNKSTMESKRKLFDYYFKYLTDIKLKDRFEEFYLKEEKLVDLQLEYIVNNPFPHEKKSLYMGGSNLYGEFHKKYHPFFKEFIEKYDGYDFILVSSSGKIVYTVSKELDFLRNIHDKALKTSPLGDSFFCALSSGKNCKSKIGKYLPSKNLYTSFISAPIFLRTKLVGVAIIQTPQVGLNLVVGNSILGTSTFIVNEKNELITEWINASDGNKWLLGTKINFIEKSKFIDESGNLYFVSSQSFNFSGQSFKIVSLVSENLILRPINSLMLKLILALVVICFLLTIIAHYVSLKINLPLNIFNKKFDEIKSQGSLSKINVDDLSSDFHVMSHKFNGLIDELQESYRIRDFITTIVSSLKEMLFVCIVKNDPLSGNIDVIIKTVNSAVVEGLEVEHQKMLGASITDYCNIHKVIIDNKGQILKANFSRTFEGELISKTWGKLPCLFGLSTVLNNSDKSIYMIITAMDLTEQKRNLSALAVANEKALIAMKARSEFLSNVSHEIRTPINAIVGMSELIRETELSGDQKHYIQILSNSARVLQGLVENVLDFSRVESGAFNLNKEIKFFLNEIVDDSFLVTSTYKNKSPIDLIVDIDSQVPNSLMGDGPKLKQVLINLLSNAIKFTESGEVKLTIRKIQEKNGKDIVLEFTVDDTGIGVPEKSHKTIFESFKQIDSSTSKKHRGIGLGLSVAKSFVELMGGRIGFVKKDGPGARVTFDLPFVRLDNGLQFNKNLFSDMRVLFVDDNINNHEIYLNYLTRFLPAPDIALNGEDALTKLKENHYDLVITDYYMDGISGYDLALKAQKELAKEVAFLIFTARSISPEIAEFNSSKNLSFASKPVTPFSLYQKILELQSSRIEKKTEQMAFVEKTDFSDISILCVDDCEENRILIAAILKKYNFKLDFAENGFKAIEKYKSQFFNLILMDIQMPVMDGYEATRLIRKFEVENSRERIPILAVTGNATEDDVAKSFECGCDMHITKPINRVDFFNKIKLYISTPDNKKVKNVTKVS